MADPKAVAQDIMTKAALAKQAAAENTATFANRLFAARQHAHVLHLATPAYPAHMALGEFYDGILNLADAFIETYQGEHGLLTLSSNPPAFTGEAIPFLTALAGSLKEAREGFAADPHLQNLIDEISALTYRTLYKLKYLK